MPYCSPPTLKLRGTHLRWCLHSVACVASYGVLALRRLRCKLWCTRTPSLALQAMVYSHTEAPRSGAKVWTHRESNPDLLNAIEMSYLWTMGPEGWKIVPPRCAIRL